MRRIWRDPDGKEWTVTLGYETVQNDGRRPVQLSRVRFRTEDQDVNVSTRRRISTLSMLSDEELIFLLGKARKDVS